MTNPTPRPARRPDPMRRIFERVLRELLVATGVIAVLGLVAGYLVQAWPGFFGALLGSLVALLFTGTTALSMLFALHRPPSVLAAVVLGSWLAKMIVLIALLLVIRDLEFYDKVVFVVVLAVSVVVAMVIDVRAVMQARIPNVEPASNSRPGEPT